MYNHNNSNNEYKTNSKDIILLKEDISAIQHHIHNYKKIFFIYIDISWWSEDTSVDMQLIKIPRDSE